MDENQKSEIYVNELNLWQVDAKCPDCGVPLHIASGQDVAFCWECTVSKENARRARFQMERIKHELEARSWGLTAGMPL